MENAGDTLGGAPPSTQAVVEMDARVENALRAIGEAQKTQPSAPNRVDETDLLRYQLLSERARRLELQHTIELKRIEVELNRVAQEGLAHIRHIEQKYGVDMRVFTVAEDGTLVPRTDQPQEA